MPYCIKTGYNNLKQWGNFLMKRNYKKIIWICVVIVVLCVCGGFAFFILGTDITEEYDLFKKTDYISRVVIESSDADDHMVYVVEGAEDVDALKRCFSRVSTHLWEVDEEYVIHFINEYTVHSIPFPGMYSAKQNYRVNSFMKGRNKKYQYTFYVKNVMDFEKLRQDMENAGRGNIVYLPEKSINETKPYIQFEYSAQAANEKEWEKAFRNDHELGEFEYDDYFVPLVDEMKDMELFFDMSRCSFSSGCSDNTFERDIQIYLNRSLSEDEIIKIRADAERHYEGNSRISNFATPFRYHELAEYEIKVIFEKEQSPEEIKAFCEKYGVDSLQLTIKEYSDGIEPFAEESPQFCIHGD